MLEGLSMYLSQSELGELLLRLADSMPRARLWVDHASHDLMKSDAAAPFLFDIARLGEPFVTSFDRVEELEGGWATAQSIRCTSVPDATLSGYLFTEAVASDSRGV